MATLPPIRGCARGKGEAGSLRCVAGGRQDSAPRHMGGHVRDKYSCVEGPGLKTAR